MPLDRNAVEPGRSTLRIYFERYARRIARRRRRMTVVSIEGGPGYSTTSGRGGRVDLWQPVSTRRDLLLVDLRGTGRSGALRCKAFAASATDYIARAGRCAAQLGP